MGKVALAVCAHPDDLEFFCGGSAVAMVRAGWDVRLVIATDGDRGTHDPAVSRESLAALRRAESRSAGQILGLSGIVFLGRKTESFMPTIRSAATWPACTGRLGRTG